MSGRLMNNLILILNIRVKRVADIKKSEINLEHKGQAGGRHQNKPTTKRSIRLERFFGGKMRQKNQFRKMNISEYNKILQSLSFLRSAATYFKEYFINKKVVYRTKDNEITVYFSESNFMHLCGFYYLKGTNKFFKDCLDNQLDISSLLVKKDGTTMQKIQILSSITELTSSHVRLTGSGRYLYLEFDYSLRTNKQILALTLKDTHKKVVPQSLLNLKKMKNFFKGEAVIEIYAVKLETNEKVIYYNEKNDL